MGIGGMIAIAVLVAAVIFTSLAGAGVIFSSRSTDDQPTTSIQLLDTQELSFSAVELYNPTTAISGETCTYYENGVKSTDTDCTFTVKRGIDYEMLVAATGYVSIVDSFTGLGEPMTGEKYELGDYMNLTNAITVYNKDGSTNAAGSRYAIGDSESKNIKFEVSGVSKDLFPGGIIVFEVNSSAIEAVDFSLGSDASTPAQYTATSTGTKAYAFTFPEVNSIELLDGTVSLTAKDGVNPGNGNVSYTVYDAQVFIDSKTDEIVKTPAVEDSDDVDVGGANEVGYIYYS